MTYQTVFRIHAHSTRMKIYKSLQRFGKPQNFSNRISWTKEKLRKLNKRKIKTRNKFKIMKKWPSGKMTIKWPIKQWQQLLLLPLLIVINDFNRTSFFGLDGSLFSSRTGVNSSRPWVWGSGGGRIILGREGLGSESKAFIKGSSKCLVVWSDVVEADAKAETWSVWYTLGSVRHSKAPTSMCGLSRSLISRFRLPLILFFRSSLLDDILLVILKWSGRGSWIQAD